MLTQSRLKELLDYNPDTGDFVWLVSRGMTKAGNIAGALDSRGYLKIGIEYKRYVAHRLVWFYLYGIWPEKQIDHINGNREDNRIDNLREATHAQNQRNRRLAHSNSKSGIMGVWWVKPNNKWVVSLTVNGTRKHLGYFSDLEEAKKVYLAAKRKYHDFCTI